MNKKMKSTENDVLHKAYRLFTEAGKHRGEMEFKVYLLRPLPQSDEYKYSFHQPCWGLVKSLHTHAFQNTYG